MKTLGMKFKEQAKKLMPQHPDLLDFDSKIDNPEKIDQIMFDKSEYIGGMADVILAICK